MFRVAILVALVISNVAPAWGATDPAAAGIAPQGVSVGQDVGEVNAQMEQLRRVLAHPAVQAYLRLFQNPVFAQGVEKVIQHPNRRILLYCQLGFFVGWIIFRAWRMSKSQHWAYRLWVKFYSALFYAFGASVVLPLAVLGGGYADILRGIFQLLPK